MEEIEQSFRCPYCGEQITMLFDLSAGDQQYVEDCEVCCNPVTIAYTLNENGEIDHFSADPAQD